MPGCVFNVRVCPCLSGFVRDSSIFLVFIDISWIFMNFMEIPIFWWRETTGSGGSGHPDQYHGVPHGSAPCPLPHYPGTTTPLHQRPCSRSPLPTTGLRVRSVFTRLLLVTTHRPCTPFISGKHGKWLFFSVFTKSSKMGHFSWSLSDPNRLLFLDMTTFPGFMTRFMEIYRYFDVFDGFLVKFIDISVFLTDFSEICCTFEIKGA